MQVLTTILYILLFLVFLSILIIIHELGHLAAAKAFNVYCLEYSVGMGPLLFKYKRKGGETQFSLRAIPFGGYVSMYGEGVELPEGVEIPESRSLNGVKAWKRAIILLAGVTMNAVLAIAFFFVSNCFPQESIDYVNHLNVKDSAIGLVDGDYVKYEEFAYHDDVSKKDYVAYLADNQTYFNDDETHKYATCFNFATLSNFKNIDLAQYICFYELKNDPVTLYSKVDVTNFNNQTIYIPNDISNAEHAYNFLVFKGIINDYSLTPFDPEKPVYHSDFENLVIKTEAIDKLNKKVEEDAIAIVPSAQYVSAEVLTYARDNQERMVPDFIKYVSPKSFDKATIHLTRRIPDESSKYLVDGDIVAINITQKDGVVDSFGCSLYYQKIQYNFGQIVGHAFSDFGRSSIVLFQAIGDLFTKPSAWANVGGIISVGFETTSVLQNFGFGKFLFYWGFISVNLAIFNLLPFPGLDGWQLLVLIVESTTRKKIPEKVKNIVSLIGIGLLLLLMGVVVVKDLIKYVFVGASLL
jgi:membrane-associated protease RseP (regulator of RpoE activity)